MTTTSTAAEMEALADTLWAERHVVELLLFKLVTAKLVLAADERRFVAPALNEVERVVASLRQAELRRSTALAGVSLALGVDVDALTLGRLAAEAPEPWRSIFADHHTAFEALAAEIEETAAANRKLASLGLSTIQQTIDTLTGPSATATTYDARGRSQPVHVGPLRLDEAL